MKTTFNLGLDLGTNSVAWSLIKKIDNELSGIVGMGSHIIPMSQDILGKFDSGVSVSQTAERTNFRSIRRLRERHLLRRERLHRVLNIIGFLPQHYATQIDFDNNSGQFKEETEPKLAYHFEPETGKTAFYFQSAFTEMLEDFRQHQPDLVADGKKIPYDWTIYYLRCKALTHKIEKEELAWLLLQFNQKRGYYQLRGEEEAEETPNKKVAFYALQVVRVEGTDEKKGADTWYNVHLENGWIYRRTSRVPLDWTGKTKEFIVTTELNEDGTEKLDKEGKVRRSFRAPAETDWTLIKKKTEQKIEKSRTPVGKYIYENLLTDPAQKIKGKLVRTIERSFYKDELKAILEKQSAFHPELKEGSPLYQTCLEELYPHNDAHRESIAGKDFVHLFLNDIIFYQRPLKSKKSLISNCKFEVRRFVKDGKVQVEPLKGIAKSHPLFQEFRLWQFLQNLRIFKKETGADEDVTKQFLSTEEQKLKLFSWLNSKKEIKQEALLKQVLNSKKVEGYRWNYIDSKEKTYPGNETGAEIANRLQKAGVPEGFLTPETEEALWHILYSVEDKADIAKALNTFAQKHHLGEAFVEQFKKFPRLEKEYGSYSAKALKKLLPLMRIGPYWNEQSIIRNTQQYQQNVQKVIATTKDKEARLTDEQRSRGKSANQKLLEKLQQLQGNPEDYQGLEHHIASYVVYGRHSEDSDMLQWRTPADIDTYLREVFKQHSLRNPIVEGVIRETLQVVKDIWEYYGNSQPDFFDEIHVELSREMKNPAEERERMTRQMNENENTNLRIKALLAELQNDGTEGVRSYSPMQQEILKLYEEGALSAVGSNLPEDILKISRLPQPSSAELKRYKLWLEQGYRSPYTGVVIPLNRLFTRAYDIEHIIPQSRFFDDSLSNKIICETEVNADKGNRTAYEYIKAMGGAKVKDTNINLLPLAVYEDMVKRDFSKSKSKARKLLMEEIPEEFVERQMNDTRYISKVVKSLLSNIVREDGEQEAISKKVIPVTGAVTSQMKKDWGLENIWNELISPRFKRLNDMTASTDYGEIKPNTGKFLPKVPLLNQKGFSKKRIDHRHHALDALVIACTTREHVNYLHSLNSKRNNLSLVNKLRRTEKYKLNGNERDIAKEFKKPWETFTQDAREALEKIVVSFKQNTRVLTKTANQYQKWVPDEEGKLVKKMVPQQGNELKAIRKPMHKDTVYGLVKLRSKKTVSLSAALDTPEMITDKSLRKQVATLIRQGYDKKKLVKFFKEVESKWDGKDISRVEVQYWEVDKEGKPLNVATRTTLNDSFNLAAIETVTDTGIRKILRNHLLKYNEDKNGKTIEHPELAFSPDGIDAMNENLKNKGDLNGGKFHQPIYKVRTYEPLGNKFAVGETGNKKDKFVVAAKGTNLFFGIYHNPATSKRSYDTIQLNVVIERKKQGLPPVPEKNEAGDALLMYLSPNDLVYVPDEQERQNLGLVDFNALTKEQVNRVYKIVSFTNNRLYAIPATIAKSIVDKVEFTQMNKLEFSLGKQSIKDVCIKLQADRLGNVKLV